MMQLPDAVSATTKRTTMRKAGLSRRASPGREGGKGIRKTCQLRRCGPKRHKASTQLHPNGRKHGQAKKVTLQLGWSAVGPPTIPHKSRHYSVRAFVLVLSLAKTSPT